MRCKPQAAHADGTSFDSGVVGDGGAGWRWEPPGDDARFSIAPGDYALPALEDFSSDAGSTGTHADVVRSDVAIREAGATVLRPRAGGTDAVYMWDSTSDLVSI
jgi:hypothetical protein